MAFDLVEIGFLHKARGIKGFISCRIHDEYETLLRPGSFIFVEQDGLPIPYLVQDVQEANRTMIKVEDIDDPEATSEISQKAIFVERDSLPSNLKITPSSNFFIGKRIMNQNHLVGEIIDVEEFPEQLMLIVKLAHKTVQIPFVMDWLDSELDESLDSINMNLPDGILDL